MRFSIEKAGENAAPVTVIDGQAHRGLKSLSLHQTKHADKQLGFDVTVEFADGSKRILTASDLVIRGEATETDGNGQPVAGSAAPATAGSVPTAAPSAGTPAATTAGAALTGAGSAGAGSASASR